jgi:hypothetical protein
LVKIPFWEVPVPPVDPDLQVFAEVQLTLAPDVAPVESINVAAEPVAPAWLFQKVPAMGIAPAVTAEDAMVELPAFGSVAAKFMLMDWP